MDECTIANGRMNNNVYVNKNDKNEPFFFDNFISMKLTVPQHTSSGVLENEALKRGVLCSWKNKADSN